MSFFSWLSGLFSTKSTTVPGTLVHEIQAATVQACSFLPMAESVEALVIASNPAAGATLALVTPIAHSICAVVSKPQPVVASLYGVQQASWVVNGVPVQGTFVK